MSVAVNSRSMVCSLSRDDLTDARSSDADIAIPLSPIVCSSNLSIQCLQISGERGIEFKQKANIKAVGFGNNRFSL